MEKTKLTTFQLNFLKELMGDTYMSDIRATTILSVVCTKFGVNPDKILDAVTARKTNESTEAASA